MQLHCLFLKNRGAQNAAGVTNHERDGFRRRLACGHDQIALVFTIIVVDDHDHFTLSYRRQGLFNGVEDIRVVFVAHEIVAQSKTEQKPSTAIYVQTVKANLC